MKKTTRFLSILAILLFAVSCQNSDIDGGQTINKGKLNLSATIVTPDATRVTYAVDNDVNHVITPSWTVGDEIIGWDDQGETFTFTVSAVDAGRATLDAGTYVPGSATKLYAIYAPGKTPSNFGGSGSARTLDIDLSSQNGVLNNDSPVLMCATAEITAGSATLSFENQTAIIGVTKFKLPAAATITSISVDGLVTAGSFEVSGDVLVLTPATTTATATATGSWATGEGNICTTAIYFATLPTTGANIVLNASDGANDYANLSTIATTNIEAGNYYYMAKNLGAPVADVNGVKYGTIDEAWTAANAAKEDVTVTLLSDCTAAAGLVLNNSASGTGAVTFDLNGKTLTTTAQIQVLNGRSLTITDNSSALLAEQGRIEMTTGLKAHTVRVNASSFTLLGGTLDNQNAALDSCYTVNVIGNTTGTFTSGAIISTYRGILMSSSNSILVMDGDTRVTSYRAGAYINGPATVGGTTSIKTEDGPGIVMNGSASTLSLKDNVSFDCTGICVYQYHGSLTITGGSYSNTNNMLYMYGSSACTASISGGSFESTTTGVLLYARNANCTLNVTGGSFKSETCSGIATFTTDAATHVTGGIFSRPIHKVTAKDAEDNPYVNILNSDPATQEDYPFTVSPASATPEVAYTARTGNTDTLSHGSLQSAAEGLNTYNAEQDFHLTQDVTETSSVTLACSKKVNLYLDDHVITTSAARAVELLADVDIYDGPLGTGGVTNTTANYALINDVAEKKVNIHGGTFQTAGATYGALRFYGLNAHLTVDGKTVFKNTGSGSAVNFGGTAASSAPTVTIDGGTFIAQNGLALRCGYGVTTVTGGTFVGSTSAAQTVNSANLFIHGGYFYNGSSDAAVIISHTGTNGHVDGGWFSKAPLAAVLADNYIAQNGSTTVDGRDYTHQVVVGPAAVPVASVNGTDYYTFGYALDAALAYDGGDATVTLKLKTDVTDWLERMDMTNSAGKPVVFDLNGHTFGVAIDSAMTTTGTLTITDNSGLNTGKYTSNKRKQLYLFGSGTVNISRCIIECTRAVYRNTGATYCMIAVVGSSGANSGTVNVSSGAKIYSLEGFKPFNVYYGNLNFSGDCEITCGTVENGGYYCIMEDTGGVITIDAPASFRSFNSTAGTKYGIIRSATGRDISSVTINGGYFYGGNIFAYGDTESYAKPFKIKGGYYSFDFRSNLAQATITGTWNTLSPATSHSHNGESLSYGYSITTP